MNNQKQQRANHKAQLYRLLMVLTDNNNLVSNIFFREGTCCMMLGFLDRFSVDLDFDLKENVNKKKLRKELHLIFDELNLEIKDESKEALQFFLKYEASTEQRSTIKLEILDKVFDSNDYKPQYLEPIDRTAICQTIESMFANKLVALIDRYRKRKTIAGRDLYDIHYFFTHGYDYKKEIIKERTNKEPLAYFKELKKFIKDKIDQKIIDQDLNLLLPKKKFQAIRKSLKTETLVIIKDEIKNGVN